VWKANTLKYTKITSKSIKIYRVWSSFWLGDGEGGRLARVGRGGSD